jgi:hypothetical protein
VFAIHARVTVASLPQKAEKEGGGKGMAAGKTIGFALLGLIAGAILGGVAGLLGGLAWTSLNQTSGFEGYSGFVVFYWIFGGIILGLAAGLVVGTRLGRR